MATNPNLTRKGGAVAVLAVAMSTAVFFEGSRLRPYRDLAGVPTVCYGHTGGVQDRAYSPDECRALLRADMAEANAAVHRCITVPMNTGQEAALTDATYNVGPAVVCGSTLQRLANAREWDRACAQLSRWIYAGGRIVPGLVKRRAEERRLCEASP